MDFVNTNVFVWLRYITTQHNTSQQPLPSADEDMLRCVRNELDYRTDIRRVTKGSNIEYKPC
jgi:hypothetical protein